MSIWHFCYLFVVTLAYTVLQCLCLWSQHCSASKGREEAGLGMWSSLMARAAKQPPQWTWKDVEPFKCSAGNWWVLENISLYYLSSHRGTSVVGALAGTNEVFFAVQLHWDCGQPSQWLPTGVTTVTAPVPGCQFTQVTLWDKWLGSLSNFQRIASAPSLKSGWDRKPGDTALLEGWGYLEATMVVMSRGRRILGESSKAKEKSKDSSLRIDLQGTYWLMNKHQGGFWQRDIHICRRGLWTPLGCLVPFQCPSHRLRHSTDKRQSQVPEGVCFDRRSQGGPPRHKPSKETLGSIDTG